MFKSQKQMRRFILIIPLVLLTIRVGAQDVLNLEANTVIDYQVADRVIARNVRGDPRFDTAIWPGYNVSNTMQFSIDEKAADIINMLKRFNTESAFNDDELLTVYRWTIDNYFFD
jgi:hypothetical protein